MVQTLKENNFQENALWIERALGKQVQKPLTEETTTQENKHSTKNRQKPMTAPQQNAHCSTHTFQLWVAIASGCSTLTVTQVHKGRRKRVFCCAVQFRFFDKHMVVCCCHGFEGKYA